MAEGREIFEKRELGAIEPDQLSRVEALVAEEVGAPPSATQVGRVFGCSSARGLNVLVRREDASATLVVNDVGAPNAASRLLALQVGILIMLLPVTAMAMFLGGGLSTMLAVMCGLLVATLFVGPIRKRRARARVARVADAIERALVRVEVRDQRSQAETPEEQEVLAEASEATARRRA